MPKWGWSDLMKASAPLRVVSYLPLEEGSQPLTLTAAPMNLSRWGWAAAAVPTPCSRRTRMFTGPPALAGPATVAAAQTRAASAAGTRAERGDASTGDLLLAPLDGGAHRMCTGDMHRPRPRRNARPFAEGPAPAGIVLGAHAVSSPLPPLE